MGEGFEIRIRPEECFRLSNGRVLKNLNELLNALKSMDDETFKSHADENKNDFGNWVRDVFKDEELAKLIFNSKTREDIVKAIEAKLFEADKKEYIKIEVDELKPYTNKIRKSFAKDASQKKVTSGRVLSTQNLSMKKIEKILMKEKEIEKREEKIEEIEARIEKELAELAAKKEPKFFSKEFVQGLLIGLLFASIISLIYIKIFV